MIEEVVIDKVGSYNGPTQLLHGLSKFNYLYGANGAGKTTISKIINDPEQYPTCPIKWKNNISLISYVYNKDFVERNFSQDKIKGVFTLGSDLKEDEEKLISLKEEKNKLMESIIAKEKLIDGGDNELGVIKQIEDHEKSFKDSCWKQKVKHDNVFSKAFEGLRNSSEKFKARVLAEYENNTSEVCSIAELIEKAKIVFSTELTSHVSITIPSFNRIDDILSREIWSERILGKKDVSVSDLITMLNNSDWVKEGLTYFSKSNPKCPFCQQDVNDNIFDNLSSYFDKTYELKKREIDALVLQYEYQLNNILKAIDDIRAIKSPFINYEVFEDKAKIVLSELNKNFELAKNKRNFLSESVHFSDLSEVVDDFISFLNDSNLLIDNNNKIHSNRKVEASNLSKQIWAYIVKVELKSEITSYRSKSDKFNRKLQGLKSGIEEDKKKLMLNTSAIEAIESNKTSTLPTITKINKILDSYGFKNFYLKPSEDKKHYMIVRDSGDNARTTLSEGEKTFITFLYFYSLVRGSDNASGVLDDRVVVFDDPISSLDSDILFIVSSLIKDLMEDVRKDEGNIKQIIFLTHNIYFHKELTFNTKRSGNQAMKEETFWIVRKKGKVSYLEKCESNPIKTSYDLLWCELRRTDINNNTIQNTMRRILENYFKILGGMDIRKLECHFYGDEKIIFKSLVSWINDGSHFAGDDLYMNLDTESVQKYLIVFQKIFECSEHTAHYKMMMGEFY
ncbi:TPA: AAA family ATPase, partial [Escherichia coli]|nr:AAA family ATPase [Escherichia coli]